MIITHLRFLGCTPQVWVWQLDPLENWVTKGLNFCWFQCHFLFVFNIESTAFESRILQLILSILFPMKLVSFPWFFQFFLVNFLGFSIVFSVFPGDFSIFPPRLTFLLGASPRHRKPRHGGSTWTASWKMKNRWIPRPPRMEPGSAPRWASPGGVSTKKTMVNWGILGGFWGDLGGFWWILRDFWGFVVVFWVKLGCMSCFF